MRRLAAAIPVFIIAFVAAVLAALGAALLINIFERKQEARNPFYRVVELNERPHPASGAKTFRCNTTPICARLTSSARGSAAVRRWHAHRTGGPALDCRPVATRRGRPSEDHVGWVCLCRDFREDRGHAYMLADQTFTERQQVVQQPGTCLHCHASVYTVYKQLGQGT